MTKTVGLARCGLITPGLSMLSISLFPPPPKLQSLIHGIPVARFTRLADTFLWPYNKGTCSVESASKFLCQQQQVPWNKPLWNWIWSLTCPKEIQIFFWKAMRNWLPTKKFLTFGRNQLDDHCSRCHNPETAIHILRDYP